MTTTENTIIWEEKNLIEVSKNSVNKEISEPNVITNETKKNVTENEWKDTGKVSGIYKIINKVNGKYYVGSSNDILGAGGRWKEHINGLNAQRHENNYLQRAWNKYGKDNFEFVIVEKVPKSDLLIVEQKYLDEVKDNRRNLCYNLTFVAKGGAWNKGIKHTEEEKKKISEKLKGRIFSKETILRMSLSGTGCKNNNFDHTIYTFKNLNTNEIFTGKRYDFCKKFGYCRAAINNLIQKQTKTSYGWIVECHLPTSPKNLLLASS